MTAGNGFFFCLRFATSPNAAFAQILKVHLQPGVGIKPFPCGQCNNWTLSCVATYCKARDSETQGSLFLEGFIRNMLLVCLVQNLPIRIHNKVPALSPIKLTSPTPNTLISPLCGVPGRGNCGEEPSWRLKEGWKMLNATTKCSHS